MHRPWSWSRYFVAFTLAGIWHGSTWNFLIYGLLHGAGASAAKLWENIIIGYAGRPGLRKLSQVRDDTPARRSPRRFIIRALLYYFSRTE